MTHTNWDSNLATMLDGHDLHESTDQERAEPIKMQPGDDLHLTMLMAPHGLNFVIGKDREHLLAWGRDVWQAARRAQVVPQGWKLIPEDATEEWLTALKEQGVRIGSFESLLTDVLAAAPQPPEANPVELHQIKNAAPVVPQFSKVAKQKLDYLLEAGEEITGYAIENKDGRRGAIDCHGFVYWWHEAAPKQSEGEQCQSCRTGSPYACTCPFKTDRNSDPSCFETAPVQMPEPVAYVHVPATVWNGEVRPVVSFQKYEGDHAEGVYAARTPLYTEHQVRQLLAAKPTGKGG